MSNTVYPAAAFDLRTYKSPGPVASQFLADRSPVRIILGPQNSGKTNLSFFDALVRASRMPRCVDGFKRYSRVFLRNTYDNLWSTTLHSWFQWFNQGVGVFEGTRGRRASHRFWFSAPGIEKDLEVTFHFLALQEERIEDVLKGTEYTDASMGEVDELPEDALHWLAGRVELKRYPPLRLLPPEAIGRDGDGNPVALYDTGVTGDANFPDVDSWLYELMEVTKPWGHALFKQPSGRSLEGENRVGGASRDNYEHLAKLNAHKPWWVKRMIDAQYGPDRSGQAVYADEYSDERHLAPGPLEPIPGLGIRLGFDQGVRGPAMIAAQYTFEGQLRGLGELVPGVRMGETRFAEQAVTWLKQRFPGAKYISAHCDPAGFSGGDKEMGDLAWAETVSRHLFEAFGITMQAADTNAIDARLDGVKQLLLLALDNRRWGFLMGDDLPVLRRGFNAKYQYQLGPDGKTLKGDRRPVKNLESNPHDALQYLVLGIFGLHGVIQGGPGRKSGTKGPDDRDGPGDEDDDLLERRRGTGPRTEFDVFKC